MSTANDNASASIDMLAILGLQQQPYLNANTARFFYADPGLLQRLDLLQHLVQFGDMLLCISGPPGSGKTTLAEQFLLRGTHSWRSCHLNAVQIQQPSDILTQLAEGFALHASTSIERLKIDLLRQIQNIRHNSQLPVLVIDDAHLLSDDAIRTLLELAEQPRETLKQLRIALFGEPGLTQRLTAMGWHTPQQPLLHSMDIPSFDEHQSAAYLMYRLAVAGYSGESPFSLTEIRALHKAAAGLPGKLNTLAHQTLLEDAGRIASRKVVSAPQKQRRTQLILALGLIGSALIAGYVWQLQQPGQPDSRPEPVIISELSAPDAQDSPSVTATTPAEALSPEPTESLDKTPKIPQAIEDEIKKLESTGQVMVEPSPSIDPERAPASVPQASATPPTSAPTQATAPAITAPPPVAVTSPPAAAQPDATAKAIPATAPTPTAPVAAVATLESPTTATPEAKPEIPDNTPQPPATAPAPAAPTTATPVADTPTAAAKPITPPTPTTPKKAELLGGEWLQSRSASRYTLQLLGGRSEKSLRDFLRQNNVPEPVAIFRTEFKGADWYVMVHGDYPSFAAARSAVASLPTKVRDGKPWARSFATVQADIKKARP